MSLPSIKLSRQHVTYIILGLFALIVAWLFNILIYTLLFITPILIVKFFVPELGAKKAIGFGLFLCGIWYLVNTIAFITLAPVSHLGVTKTVTESFQDLLKYPELINEALKYGMYRKRLFIILIGTVLFLFALANTPQGRGMGLHKIFEIPGGFKISKRTTMGSSRWAKENELRKFLNKSGPGLVLGKNPDTDEMYILPYKNEKFEYQRNQNIVVFGATGAGKSASFVKPNILQADTSFVITDPKAEIYHELAPYLRKKGYKVYRFNLVNMRDTNCWNPLVKKDGSCDLSIQDAVLIASSIIRNTKDPMEKGGDPFWEKAEQALLTALIIYAANHFEKPEEKTFSNILHFATARTPAALDYDFGKLPITDPARVSFNVYQQASEKVRSSIIISLGTRLQLFQDDDLAYLTSRSDFDIRELGEEKTAIFVNLSDFDDTYNSVSALFFTQAFQELYRLAAEHGGTLPVFTRFVMDEFCNIGFIPSYTVKLSTMRSRGISAQMIIQSLGQLENRYPSGLSEEIIGNCDVRLMLGANDAKTAKYFTELIGKSTVEQETHSVSDRVIIDAGTRAQRETSRDLITPDEILRLQNQEALLLIRGSYPAKIHKLFYKEHPNAADIPESGSDKIFTLSKPQSDNSLEDELLAEIQKGLNGEVEDIQDSTSTTSQEFEEDYFDEPIIPIPDEDFQP